MTQDEQIKALTERLNACYKAIDEAADMLDVFLSFVENHAYIENINNLLISELEPTEELLIKIEKS